MSKGVVIKAIVTAFDGKMLLIVYAANERDGDKYEKS